MSHQILFICGGAWSGKTDRALAHAKAYQNVVWIGTAANSVPGIHEQILELKSARPPHWITLDSPFELPHTVAHVLKENTNDLLVIDSVSQWLSNEIAKFSPRYDEKQLFQKLLAEIEELCDQIRLIRNNVPLIIVSSDFGQSVPPQDPLARTLRMTVGRANQSLARLADKSEFLMSGVVISEKTRC